MIGANMRSANQCQLDGANLSNARLDNANLNGANLSNARLDNADLGGKPSGPT